MPEAELARVDECDRSIPRRETIRGTHWQKTPFGCLDLASRNPSWQRSCATATTDRTYDRKRSDSHEQTLATRGPSTYGSLLSQGRRWNSGSLPREPRAAIQPRQIAVIILRRLRAHDGVTEAGVLAGRMIDVFADRPRQQLHARGARETLRAVALQRGRVIIMLRQHMRQADRVLHRLTGALREILQHRM